MRIARSRSSGEYFLGGAIAPHPSRYQGLHPTRGAPLHTKEAAAAGEDTVRLNLVAAWRESTVFTEAERAALALAEEGTRLADAHQGVSDETWSRVREHYDEDQTAALVYVVAMINAANRLGVIVHQRGGSYEPGMFAHITN
ncbi:carboxymuconolactone decarboxylase family protein [Actinomadura sp. KC345]|uniref:carboxymuconolactone decarboxylase family protein n=1 Tax=Actinomadura sp. KC345 TaxID=2530371 RepID=UPI001FB82DF1|nr:carboxymuconolactone decarboxylase family protein [Actinomadura sp. KC345]